MPFTASEILTATELNQPPTPFVPTLTATTTSPTLGEGSVRRSWYYRVGHLVTVDVFIQFGTTGAAAGSGTYIVSLPVAADTTVHTASLSFGLGTSLGIGIVRDNSLASNSRPVVPWLATSTTVRLVAASNDVVTATAPWGVAWAESDAIALRVRYLVA